MERKFPIETTTYELENLAKASIRTLYLKGDVFTLDSVARLAAHYAKVAKREADDKQKERHGSS